MNSKTYEISNINSSDKYRLTTSNNTSYIFGGTLTCGSCGAQYDATNIHFCPGPKPWGYEAADFGMVVAPSIELAQEMGDWGGRKLCRTESVIESHATLGVSGYSSWTTGYSQGLFKPGITVTLTA